MIFGIDHHIGEKLAERRVATLLAPPLVLWAVGGGGAYLFPWEGQERFSAAILKIFEHKGGHELLVIGALLLLALLALSGVIIRRLDHFTIRLLEGYWPSSIGLRWFQKFLVRVQNRRFESKERRYQELVRLRGTNALSAEAAEEYVALDWEMARMPAKPDRRMPTRFGNVLRAAETRPQEKYGLDVIVCWPRLWLVLPENVKNELTDSRATLDSHASMITCGVMLLLLEGYLILWSSSITFSMIVWVLLTVILTWGAYRFAISAAIAYGSLMESAFDLYRPLLYLKLRMALPIDPAQEVNDGKELTEYLFRGSDSSALKFIPIQVGHNDELH